MEKTALLLADETIRPSGDNGSSDNKAGTASDQEAMRRLRKQQLFKTRILEAYVLYQRISAQLWVRKHLPLCPHLDGNMESCPRHHSFQTRKQRPVWIVVHVSWPHRCDIHG
ncbi:hypothetical protein DPSP01_008137 [Paraphaeosphaeria sporulosa]